MTAAWVLLLTTALAVAAVGTTRRLRAGRVRATEPDSAQLPAAVLAELPANPAGDLTLLQLSTTFCAPCRQTRALLADVAQRTDGLRHVELDVTDRPELADALGVRSTPTTLAVDPGGRELIRLTGVPRRDTLLTALRPYLPGPYLPGPYLPGPHPPESAGS